VNGTRSDLSNSEHGISGADPSGSYFINDPAFLGDDSVITQHNWFSTVSVRRINQRLTDSGTVTVESCFFILPLLKLL
jgi:hypothetical protein